MKCQPVAYINRRSEKRAWPTEDRVSWKLVQCVHMGPVQRSVGWGGWSEVRPASWSAVARLNELLWSCVGPGSDSAQARSFTPLFQLQKLSIMDEHDCRALLSLIRGKWLHHPDSPASLTRLSGPFGRQCFKISNAQQSPCLQHLHQHLICARWAVCTSLSCVWISYGHDAQLIAGNLREAGRNRRTIFNPVSW